MKNRKLLSFLFEFFVMRTSREPACGLEKQLNVSSFITDFINSSLVFDHSTNIYRSYVHFAIYCTILLEHKTQIEFYFGSQSNISELTR